MEVLVGLDGKIMGKTTYTQIAGGSLGVLIIHLTNIWYIIGFESVHVKIQISSMQVSFLMPYGHHPT
jgi:hypothetical protein